MAVVGNINAPVAAPSPAKWAIAREGFPCGRCHAAIGQGEAFRVSTSLRRFGICGACSFGLDGQYHPADIKGRTRLEELRDELATRRRVPAFVKFDTPGARAAWKREQRPKPSACTPLTPGSQPYADPRGQGRNRHGVAAAMRKNIEQVDVDYRRRQSGERDE